MTLGTSGEKDLGILMDSELKFSKHVEEQVLIGLIRRYDQYKERMKLLFTALVRPHLEFRNVWVPRLQKDRLLIEGVQRRATKLVSGLKELDNSERLKSMDLPSMKYRMERGDMIEIYKYIHGLYSVNNILLKIDVETVTR